jgi:hypothetical protein
MKKEQNEKAKEAPEKVQNSNITVNSEGSVNVVNKEPQKIEQPKQVAIKDVPTGKLKEIAFDVEQQIKALQRQYNHLYTEIEIRKQEGNNGD